MHTSTRRVALALLPLLFALGCSRCGGTRLGGPEAPAELAPANTQMALLVPQGLRLGQHIQQLSQLRIVSLLASLAGAVDGTELLKGIQAQLGFDFTTPEGFAAVGLDPNGPLLSAQTSAQSGLSIVSVTDEAKLQAWVDKLARERFGAAKGSTTNGVTPYARAGGPALLAYGKRGRFAIIGFGNGCDAAVAQALGRSREQSLASNTEFQALETATRGRDVVVYATPESALRQAGLSGLRFSAGLEPQRLVASVDLPLSTAQATALASMHGNAGQELIGRLDPDAFVVARTALDPATLWPVIEAGVPARLRQQLLNTGIRANEVLANVKPGAALSFSLASSADLARMPSLDPRETNPFRYIYMSGLGAVKDPAAAQATLAEVKKFGPANLGVNLEERPIGKVPVYVFKYALGEGASVALDGERLLISGGEGRMAPLLSRAAGAGYKLPTGAIDPMGSAGFAMYLDVGRLVGAIRALPDSAYGLGGFAIKAAVGRWLSAIEELRSALVTADYRAGAAGGVVHVELVAALP